ncbi:LLM class flavin-dependent oxidoreductase [Pseudomonas putida]|jgi:FMN-dependent oxidoreductase (nitrilotriacetate monooxygenase family)|uniref:LLM class flavin-dependent oxidoreductase n=1 Tax=Pseudomonas putida TaxID=303 RepID=A0ABD7BK94_PSEPU|nr:MULTISPECIES: LLM class flavin-dependent oxidoreductase [Pseudomonas]PNB59407.1 LLM class flavin-dependent oxidoreductase [Pseudomonas sp. FW305-130]AGN82063.1 monooxygenase [Pseudomonas putida H8234]MBH3450228.1 LLM class flavin-dependent oxidoreductase [Pseudomonas putida]MBH3471419.1 LLM class flavin-dependent oxidoreductase [Pseudomonas putida]MCE0781410.1 LLM class flavin-dependent oxidoreductase [Pseudomonas sp. NMI542_15]
MTTRKIKLGALTMGCGGPGRHNLWLDPELPADASVNIDWYIDIARQAEAALFDLIFIVDSQYITPGSPSHYLNRLEPLTLLSALAVTTRNIGLVGTLTTSYNEPFNVARRLASLDLISKGRAGWNVVTSGDAGTAGNYGRDEHYDYDTRYARAQEHVAVVQGLWQSYEDGAFPRNRATGQFLDPGRMHALHHKGEHFSVVGPLNIQRSPQGQPVIFQAGDSQQGRELGAATADVIFTHAASIEQGQAFYRDVKGRAARLGRDPEQLLVLPGAEIYVGDTDEHAREIERHYHQQDHSFELALKEFGRNFGWHDFSQYDLDAPFPQESLEHARSSFFTNAKRIADQAREQGFSLRQAVEFGRKLRPGAFVGSAETVAAKMTEWFEARALDGFNIYIGHPGQFRRFTQEVVPLLQERGVYRTAYEGSTLRESLGLAIQ